MWLAKIRLSHHSECVNYVDLTGAPSEVCVKAVSRTSDFEVTLTFKVATKLVNALIGLAIGGDLALPTCEASANQSIRVFCTGKLSPQVFIGFS